MSAKVSCSRCGAKPRGAKVFHDRACPLRHEAAMTGEVLAVPVAGPLVPTSPVPELTNLYDNKQLVPWLAYVGLGGRWCWAGQRLWLRWDGKKWKRTRIEHVHEAVRHALADLHERTEGLPGRDYLLTLDQTFALTRNLRITLTVDAEEIGVDR